MVEIPIRRITNDEQLPKAANDNEVVSAEQVDEEMTAVYESIAAML